MVHLSSMVHLFKQTKRKMFSSLVSFNIKKFPFYSSKLQNQVPLPQDRQVDRKIKKQYADN